jgi:hypothetical protein
MTAFIRSPGIAKNPGSPFICSACWLYRRLRVTATTLGKRQIDRQCLMNHSWFLTPEDIHVIHDKEDFSLLYEILLDPPLVFALSFIEKDQGLKNHLQFAIVNENTEILANTKLHFSSNNHLLSYTVYELEEGLRGGPEGKLPGVHAIMRALGEFEFKREGDGEKRERGRPRKLEHGEERAVTRKVK